MDRTGRCPSLVEALHGQRSLTPRIPGCLAIVFWIAIRRRPRPVWPGSTVVWLAMCRLSGCCRAQLVWRLCGLRLAVPSRSRALAVVLPQTPGFPGASIPPFGWRPWWPQLGESFVPGRAWLWISVPGRAWLWLSGVPGSAWLWMSGVPGCAVLWITGLGAVALRSCPLCRRDRQCWVHRVVRRHSRSAVQAD